MKKLKIFFMIVIFLITFFLVNRLVEPKYSTDLEEGSMTSAYYKEDKNHELIILGDCEVYANISPMVMYEEQGITSYVRGNSRQMMWQSYFILEETLKYEKPRTVLLSIGGMKNSEEEEAYNRLCIDQMKWSKQKVDIIKNSLTKDESFLSYVFPVLRYHDRITELSKEDFYYFFKTKQNTYNGFLINKEIKPVQNLPAKQKLANYKFCDKSYEYLDKITNLCKENDIELILAKMPAAYPYWYDEYEKQIVDYAKNNNLKYINFIDKTDEIGIDYKQDTYDAGLHLNLTGATKLSKYLAQVLKNESNRITDFRQNEEINQIYSKKLEQYKEVIK